MKIKFVSVFLLSLIVVACSSNDKKKELKPEPLVKFSPTAKAKKNWSAAVGAGRDKRYSKFVPAIKNNRVYVADVKGEVFALELESGKRIWKSSIKKPVSAGAGANSTAVYVGTYAGELVALSAEDGHQLWTANVSSEILGVPAANENIVVAQTIDGRAFAFNARTGESLWRYDHTVPSLTLRGTASPVIFRSQVLLAFGNGQIISLLVDDGSLKWDTRLSQPKGRTELEKMTDVDSTPFISGGLVYAANYHGAVGAFSLAQGQPVWKQDLSTFHDLHASSGKVFAVSEDSSVIAYSSGGGVVEWVNDSMLRRGLGAPAAQGDFVVTIDQDDHMHVMSVVDGSFALRFKPAGSGFSSPVVVDGENLLVLSDNGTLSSYTISSGR